MLRIVVSPNAGAAKRYFSGGLAAGDYFVAEVHEPGTWGGRGAESLGLSGSVERRDFDHLCDNEAPRSGSQLTARTNANRRVAYDFNFHCPKSVSLVHALTGDTAILESFRLAVADTMTLIEAEAKTRVRLEGAQHDRPTGNLVWATFVHRTSRPIDGIPDPHLHAHCFTFNATLDPIEGRWKAAQFGDLKRDGRYFEACFHSSLALRLREAGYGVERRGQFWEIAGLPEKLIESFSRRTTEIESEARRRGIVDAKSKAELGAKTRRLKSEAKADRDVWADWQSRLSLTDRASLAGVRVGFPRGDRRVTQSEAVAFALSKGFERFSVLSERSVLETALRHGLGFVAREEVAHELASRPLLRREVDGRMMLTTREVLQEEQAILDFARAGRGACRPLHTSPPPPLSRELTAQQTSALNVFERKEIEIGKGDVLRVTGNGRTINEAFGPEKLLSRKAQNKLFNMPAAKLAGIERPDRRYRLENGAIYRVAGFTLAGNIKLDNGYVVSKNFGHFAHGYCVTSHASQGKTVDRVLVAQSSASLAAASAEQFYVSVSRARERVTVFTDDKAGLLRSVEKSGDRLSATELAGDRSRFDTLTRWEDRQRACPEPKERDRER